MLTDFHIHTIFCDGKNTPEEIVLEAIKKGFSTIGFSGHGYTEYDKDSSMSVENTHKYIAEINCLKEKYKDKINIFCGLEKDYYSKETNEKYDYIIGSVHHILKNGVDVSIDFKAQIAKNALDTIYNGDFVAYADDYFSLVSNVAEKTNADIIGHFDIILKYAKQYGWNENKEFFAIAERAVKNLIPYHIPFEVNTGGMARGVRDLPYPSPTILKMIKNYGGNIIFTSDCHKKENLGFAFDEVKKMVKDIGFTKQVVLTHKGMEYISI
jgi:histidinol-phosphatase (PHP family)